MKTASHEQLIAGFDEAGRGCLAGAVIAAAVILPHDSPSIDGLTDSKKLPPKKREHLARVIEEQAVAWAIGRAEPAEIDRLNILHATMLAMRRAHASLKIPPELALIDGNRCPDLPCPSRAIIGGDLTEPAISAASILAKVFRDREMTIAEELFPGYGFAVHKGYPTAQHRSALAAMGPSPLHRLSFGPVRQCLSEGTRQEDFA
jgi:ribonuclease HII